MSHTQIVICVCVAHIFCPQKFNLCINTNYEKWEITISCGNKRALDCLSYQLCRIKPIAKCADIRRSLRSTKLGLNGKLIYEHVYGHMDDYLLWHQMTTVQQMNCVCDTLAKGAIKTAISSGYRDRPTQLLPREDVALIINGNKVTNDISQPL